MVFNQPFWVEAPFCCSSTSFVHVHVEVFVHFSPPNRSGLVRQCSWFNNKKETGGKNCIHMRVLKQRSVLTKKNTKTRLKFPEKHLDDLQDIWKRYFVDWGDKSGTFLLGVRPVASAGKLILAIAQETESRKGKKRFIHKVTLQREYALLGEHPELSGSKKKRIGWKKG